MKTEPTISHEPAFPLKEANLNNDYPGLAKREYLAAMAMQGILANSDADICDKTTVNGGWQHPETVCKIAVQMADALIAELNKATG